MAIAPDAGPTLTLSDTVFDTPVINSIKAPKPGISLGKTFVISGQVRGVVARRLEPCVANDARHRAKWDFREKTT